MSTLAENYPGFEFVRGADFALDETVIENDWGLYLFAFSEAGGLPQLARAVTGGEAPATSCGYVVLYAGMTASDLRTRVRRHLTACTWSSTFRKSAGMVLAGKLGLEPHVGICGRNFHFREGEHRLTDWLLDDMMIGFKVTDHFPLEEEKGFIAVHRPLLNLTGLKTTDQARRLQALRRSALPVRERRPIHRVPGRGRGVRPRQLDSQPTIQAAI